ncbi:MAG: hypothetical protein KJ057_11580 [Phycisphaerae bacterium]|nr:MAG: hypothetical protein EDS66_17335 [Planctomycetota bacterium]KAB2945455.1 MAG: hypothetical protein F9K17_09855 [Phycisphaerae bacterium]MBE7457836.1 hypothetical protein [Planctomycetia bacterium]MCL4719101.1 hypothetical protein [Phycisphaerae bacterium]MCQ3921464.1 hypothetical protein [Planctomycetota bacterium]
MIDTEQEYREAKARVKEAETRITEQGARLRSAGLAEDEIKRVIDPLKSFYLGLKEEVEEYEQRRA